MDPNDWSEINPNWVCRPLRQPHQTPISIVMILNFLAQLNQTKCTIHAFLTLYRRETTPYERINIHVYNSATEWNIIPNDLKKNPTWANNDSLSDWNTNSNIFKTVQINLSRAHMQAPLCKLNYLLTRKWNVHRTLFTSTWSPNCSLLLLILENPDSFIRVATLNWLFTTIYVPFAQGIKPLVVHSNEFHRAQPTFFFCSNKPNK